MKEYNIHTVAGVEKMRKNQIIPLPVFHKYVDGMSVEVTVFEFEGEFHCNFYLVSGGVTVVMEHRTLNQRRITTLQNIASRQ